MSWLLVLNVVVAIGTAAQAYFSYLAVQEVVRSNALTRDSLSALRENNSISKYAADAGREQTERLTMLSIAEAQKATGLTTQALRVAEESNQNARESFRLDQRAWILVSRTTLPEFRWPVNEISGEVVVQNAGRSPAMDVSPAQFAYINAPGAPSPPMRMRYCDAKGCTPQIVEAIGAGVERPFRFRVSISEEQFRRMERNELVFLVLGSINYKDIFGQDRRTNYCYVSRRLYDDQPSSFGFTLCSIGNNAN